MTFRIRSAVVLSLVVALLLTAAWLPAPQARKPLAVAVGVWPGSETLVLARERGLLKPKSVQLVEVTWASAAMRAMGNEVVDAAVLSLDELLRLRDSGGDVRVVAVTDVSQGNDALMVREGVETLEDLKGKRVGVDMRAAGMYLLALALQKAHMLPSDLQLVPLNLPESDVAFQEGVVDAVVAAEPWLTLLRGMKAHSLVDSSQINPPIYRLLVVSAQAIQERREDVAALVNAHFAMMKELRQRKMVPNLEVCLHRQGLTEEQFFKCWDGLRPVDVVENETLLGGEAPVLKSVAEMVEHHMRSRELLYRPVQPGPWLDNSFLKEVPRP